MLSNGTVLLLLGDLLDRLFGGFSSAFGNHGLNSLCCIITNDVTQRIGDWLGFNSRLPVFRLLGGL
jgi:hypothetical protein